MDTSRTGLNLGLFVLIFAGAVEYLGAPSNECCDQVEGGTSGGDGDVRVWVFSVYGVSTYHADRGLPLGQPPFDAVAVTTIGISAGEDVKTFFAALFVGVTTPYAP